MDSIVVKRLICLRMLVKMAVLDSKTNSLRMLTVLKFLLG